MQKNIWLWGWHAVAAALNNQARKVDKILIQRQHWNKIQEICHASLLSKIFIAEPHQLNMIANGNSHQGVAILTSQIDFYSIKEWLNVPRETSCLIVADLIQDAHNMGAIIRTAAAFNASGLVVTNRNCAPFDGHLAKSASGALEYLPIIEVVNIANTIDLLQKNDYTVYGLDASGNNNWKMNKKAVIILGQEGKGLRKLTKDKCDYLLSINTSEKFPVLNVSVAAGIAMSRFLDRVIYEN